MVDKIKEYWFGILLLTAALLFLLFVAIVAAAPHNDGKMRGFAPCTYTMAEELSRHGGEKKIWGVLGAVADSYFCYAAVMWQGAGLWLGGKQPTPWANYFFQPDNFEVPEELSEPLSEDLLRANRLEDDKEDMKMWPNDK